MAEPTDAQVSTSANMSPYLAAMNHFPPTYPAPTNPKEAPTASTTSASTRVPTLTVAAYRNAPTVTRPTAIASNGRVPYRSSSAPEKNWMTAKTQV